MGENNPGIVKEVRDNSISYIRMIATIMIVLCHIFQYYNNKLAWWLNVGVQIFLIISGYLYGLKTVSNIIEFYKKQILKVVIPFWSYLCVVTIFFVIYQNSQVSPKTIILAFTGAKPFVGLEHLWFVPYIVVCYLLIPILQELRDRWSLFSIRKMLIYLIVLMGIIELLGIAYSFYFVPSRINCFIIGYFLPSIIEKLKERKKELNLIIVVTAFILSIIRIVINTMIDASGVMQSLFGIIGEYSHVILGLAIFVILKTILSNSKQSVFTRLSDKYSYYVYITHHLFILSEFSLFYFFTSKYISIVVICICIALSSVCLRYVTDIINKVLITRVVKF